MKKKNKQRFEHQIIYRAEIPFAEEKISAFQAEGYELIAIFPENEYHYTLFFKRPV